MVSCDSADLYRVELGRTWRPDLLHMLVILLWSENRKHVNTMTEARLQTHVCKSILGSGCSRFSKINLLAKAKLHSKDQSESYNPLHQQPLCQGWSWEREWTIAPKQSNYFTCLIDIVQYKAPIWTLPSYSWCYIFSTLIIFLWTFFLYKLENCVLKCIGSGKA